MRKSLRGLLSPIVASAIVAVMIVGVGVAAAQPSQGQVASASKKKGKRSVGERGKRGPRGGQGAQGPQGATGPAGPAGPAGQGIPFAEAMPTNASPRIVYERYGVRIEAGCDEGAVEFKVRVMSGDHNIVQVTSFDNYEGGVPRGISAPDLDLGIPVDLLAGGSGYHDYNGLLAVRALGGTAVTIHWYAMGSIFSSQGDCIVGGTATP